MNLEKRVKDLELATEAARPMLVVRSTADLMQSMRSYYTDNGFQPDTDKLVRIVRLPPKQY